MQIKSWLRSGMVTAALALITGCGAAAATEVATKIETVIVEVEKEIVITATPAAESQDSSVTDPVDANQPQPGGTLNLSLGDDFVTFHPFFDVTGNVFKPIVFEAPIRISDQGEFEPWLAESWEVSDDGLSVTLHLQRDIKFHNGREVTADDVVWAVEYARDESYGHHLSDRFKTSTGATRIDDYTVRIDYSEVTHSNLDGIARLYLFPQEAAETIETIPVGTGPFKFVEWTPGSQATFARFEDYWQEGLPYLDQLVIKPIPDPQSRLVNLLAGSIDALVGVPLADKALVAQSPDIVLGTTPPGFTFYAFLFNVSEPPFDKTEVRQALHYALNKDNIIKTALHGEAIPVSIPYPKTSWAYPEDLEGYYFYNPDKAKALLAQAGYPDGFKAKLLIRGTSGPLLDQAQVYQQDLAKIGVELELVPTELPQYWPQLFDSKFAIVSHSTGDATVDPSGLFEGAACCRPFRNFFKITEDTTWFPEYEQVILQARAELDQEKRKKLYHKALEIFLEQSWTLPVAWQQETYAYKEYVHAFRTDLDGLIWPAEIWLSPQE